MSDLEKIRLINRKYLSQEMKGKMYARAIDKFESHYANQDYLSAFVICISLLEDIIGSTFFNIKLLNSEYTIRERRDRVNYFKNDRVKKYYYTKDMLYYLKNQRLFYNEKLKPKSELQKIINFFNKRNKIIHESMWNINSLESNHCDELYDQFNIIKQYHYISERELKKKGIRFRSNG